jgi:NAD(P)-dependent dehydrogenase (short-subunit alcohol dehydrogenase family)
MWPRSPRGLVNNAGVVDLPTRFGEMSLQRLQRMFAINLTGSSLGAREAVRRMTTKHGCHGGVIVIPVLARGAAGLADAVRGIRRGPGRHHIFTLSLAREVASEAIRVNAVRPGIIDTDIHASGGLPDRARHVAPMVPMQRAGTAEEVAQAIVWLLSDEASYTTDAVLDVTGGR